MYLVRLHIKVLVDPVIPIDTLVDNMRNVYQTVGIAVEIASVENLNLPELMDLEVGTCTPGLTTGEQQALFTHRNSAGEKDVVVYFVRTTVPPLNGCAAHPNGVPAAVVVRNGSLWTLAHEVGHVLGLPHVDDYNRLMTTFGTINITNPPPDLTDAEGRVMLVSGFTSPIA